MIKHQKWSRGLYYRSHHGKAKSEFGSVDFNLWIILSDLFLGGNQEIISFWVFKASQVVINPGPPLTLLTVVSTVFLLGTKCWPYGITGQLTNSGSLLFVFLLPWPSFPPHLQVYVLSTLQAQLEAWTFSWLCLLEEITASSKAPRHIWFALIALAIF